MAISLALLRKPAAYIARHESWVVAAIIGYGLVWAVRFAQRELWFDELFTFYIARLPRLDQLFHALPGDGNPPLYYLLARLCMRVLGETELAIRMPSILAFGGSLWGTYLFVRRRCDAIPSIFALFAYATAASRYYSAEARPYELLMGFTVLTLLSWQLAAERTTSRFLPLAGVAVGVAGAIASHHYGIFHVGIPLAFGEATRFAVRRKLDLPLYASVGVGALMLAVTVPLMRETNLILLNEVRASSSFYAAPSGASLQSYTLMVNPWLVGLFLAALAITRPFRSSASKEHRQDAIPTHEIAAAAGLALLVPFLIGLTWLATGYYQPRYAVGATIGIAILLGFGAARAGGDALRGAGAALLCMAAMVVSSVGIHVARLIHRAPPASQVTASVEPTSALLSSTSGEEPVVVGSPLIYLQAWHYASPAMRGRLRYLFDLSFAIRQKDPLPELSLMANRAAVPARLEAYRPFLNAHDEFLVYCTVGEDLYCKDWGDWIVDRLRSEGWTLKLVSARPGEAMFIARKPNG